MKAGFCSLHAGINMLVSAQPQTRKSSSGHSLPPSSFLYRPPASYQGHAVPSLPPLQTLSDFRDASSGWMETNVIDRAQRAP